jgi:hypothetical protein
MKFDLRLQLVRCALDHGVKPAARAVGCTPRIARKGTPIRDPARHLFQLYRISGKAYYASYAVIGMGFFVRG